jgi:7,8-dihydroneopterin aldolase/epimerase/oxygenase
MTIEIRALTFECIIGILDFERREPQRIVVEATIDYDYIQGSFLDYAAVAELIKTQMQARKFELIEEALAHLSGEIKRRFPASKRLTLTISKPDILPDCRVCVTEKSIF